MNEPSPRTGAAALVAAAVLVVAYPALRPYGDLDPATAAAAFASPWWVVAHLCAVAAFLLIGAGLVTLPGPVLRAAAATWWVGTGLVLTYYGAETFALNALGARVDDPATLAGLAEAIRLGPAASTVFLVGLLLLAAAGVLVAVGLRASALLTALPFAAGAVLLLPQFFASPALRIAHGVLFGVGCLLLARHATSVRRLRTPARS